MFLSLPKTGSSGICIDQTMLAVVTMSTLMWGSRVTSLLDKFLSTTATPDPSSINLEVLPEMNTLLQFGVGSTNTWTCFWC